MLIYSKLKYFSMEWTVQPTVVVIEPNSLLASLHDDCGRQKGALTSDVDGCS